MGYHPGFDKTRPCWTCCWWDGMAAQGSAALCAQPGSSKVRATPETGCSGWEREPGADDEPLTTALMCAAWQHVKWPEPSLQEAVRRRQRTER